MGTPKRPCTATNVTRLDQLLEFHTKAVIVYANVHVVSVSAASSLCRRPLHMLQTDRSKETPLVANSHVFFRIPDILSSFLLDSNLSMYVVLDFSFVAFPS